MTKSICTAIIFLAIITSSFAQQPAAPHLGPDAPEWARMLTADNPNVFDVQKAYADYYRERPFEKNAYTQFYKRWMHWARPYVQGDGFVHVPSVKEQEEHEAQLKALRSNSLRSSAEGVWSFAGPNQTYHTDGATVVTWQTNIYSVDIAPSNPDILYAGGETGGVWRTVDKGQNWTLLTVDVSHGGIGAVKIHPSNPDIAYACTGGKIIKTTNGGASWSTVYSENNLWVNVLAISTADPNIVLAAADQGLLRTVNGGSNWTKLFSNTTWDVDFKVGDPNTVYAIRKNGSGSDFIVSSNAGAAFSPSNSGWYTPGSGITVSGAHIALCPSNPTKLYAYLAGDGGNLGGYIGVYKSTNGGQSWSNTNPSNAIGQPYTIPTHTNLMDANGVDWFYQGFYDMAIIVNPNNDNQLIAGGCSWFKSTDGGATWSGLGGYVGNLSWSHPDIQCIAAQGNDLWIGSDGGLNYSTNFAQTSEARMNGISGADLWGFDGGWNDDILVGGRYHNGNMAWHESMPFGKYFRMGGAESPTGYVNPGPGRKTYFSDIGNYSINGGLTGGVTQLSSLAVYPNESYAYYANSEVEYHPQCWNILYLGYLNDLWKSEDGGNSFTVLHTFPGTADNTVFDIEIARSNPQVMYCSQWDGADDAIWRSADGGQTWTKCTALPLPNNNDRVKLALSDTDANVLWAAVTYGSNGKKIYKTTNGGQSWTNLTTAALNGIRITNIMPQYGTDGGVYLGCAGVVFYRNNSMNDWAAYTDGLPVSAETNRLKPFYRDGKIRNGCWGFGVWEAPLFEPSATMPLGMADKLESGCARDTFYFDDHSVVLHDGAGWNWDFPGAAYVSGENTRTPKVVFGTAGAFEAHMAISTPEGIFRDTLFLNVGDGCDRDSLPGQALSLDGSGDFAQASTPMNLNKNTVTLTAWIRPNGTQTDWAGIVFCRGGSTTSGLSLRSNNELRYHWNDGGYNFASGLTVGAGWSHVALVITPSNATLYVNGNPAVHNAAQAVEAFDAPLTIGYDPNFGTRYFKGLIDEVCVYDRALTQAEIREQMNLTRTHTSIEGLCAYYQFNEAGGRALDRAGTYHLGLSGDATRVVSTVPAGPGVAARKSVVSGKRHGFDGTGLTLLFGTGASLPNGEVVVTRINLRPDTVPVAPAYALPNYWILRNYGSTVNFTSPALVEFDQLDGIPADLSPNACKLWRRVPAAADGYNWANIDSAETVVAGQSGLMTFEGNPGVNRSGQYWLSVPGWYEARPEVEAADRKTVTNDHRVTIHPNPVASGSYFTVETNLEGQVWFRLFDDKGRAIRVQRFEAQTSVSTENLPAGAYTFRIENGRKMQIGQVVVF